MNSSRRGSTSWASSRQAWAVRGAGQPRQPRLPWSDNFRSLSQAALAEAKLPDLNNTRTLDRPPAAPGCGSAASATSGPTIKTSATALGDATESDAVLLLSHNPDFVETIRDRRVGLVLSGHTHGGQIVLPGLRSPRRPVSVRTEISLWPGPGPMLPGLRHPRRRHRHSAGPVPLPAGGRPDHARLNRLA